MQIQCPVVPAHAMVEIADGLYQCPQCGAGPVEFWAIGLVDVDGDVVGGVTATWRPELECYVLAYARWEVDVGGRRTPGSLRSSLVGYCSTDAEMREAPLPARGPAGEVLRLRAGMFSSPLGEKSSGPTGARSGRSAAGPAPSGGGSPGSPPRRRKRAG